MSMKRLDVLLFEKGLARSRKQASDLIKEGAVKVNGKLAEKPSQRVDKSAEISIENKERYVSRGGYKLKKALDSFRIDLSGITAIDVGASTGGFTDCMLKNGAKKIYAVDVGHSQLDESLKKDARVVNIEHMNIKDLTFQLLGETVQFAAVDLSFISLTKVLENVFSLLDDKGQAVCLIKPQFEAGKEKVGKSGIVRDKNTHIEVIKKVSDFAAGLGFGVLNLDFSPIKGQSGNIEYLIHLSKSVKVNNINNKTIIETVNCAHSGG